MVVRWAFIVTPRIAMATVSVHLFIVDSYAKDSDGDC